jgi:hypothetical protein
LLLFFLITTITGDPTPAKRLTHGLCMPASITAVADNRATVASCRVLPKPRPSFRLRQHNTCADGHQGQSIVICVLFLAAALPRHGVTDTLWAARPHRLPHLILTSKRAQAMWRAEIFPSECKGGDSFGARRWCVRLSSVVCSVAGLGGLGLESD